MQQQQHGGGGSGGAAVQQFGVQQQVEMPPPFSPAGQRISLAEAPSPISSRPPPAQQFDELGVSTGTAAGGCFDAEGLAAAAAGEEGASGGSAGNRWPRQETLALLKIRQDMDAAFRDATLKGPLWEQVSRKLAEHGYNRSAKKCKEKFENVHKYYKRTKDGRAGKTYRFFSQLEALHATGSLVTSFAPPSTTVIGVVSGPLPVRTPAEPPPAAVSAGAGGAGMLTMGNMMSFSTSNTEDYSDEDDSDDEGTQELGGGADERGKRKRLSSECGAAAGRSGSGKMTRFFEALMKQVMERQEAMQQRFLEAVEKREQDRMIREEAWRRQEMTRLAREQEILAQERAMAFSRDAAVLSFIQKITGHTIPMPSIAVPAINAMQPPSQPHPAGPTVSSSPSPPPSQPPASQTTPPPQPQPSTQPLKSPTPATPQAPPTQQQSWDIIMRPAEAPHADTPGYDASGGSATTSSRWPKSEVHALIQLRSNLDTRYDQEAGPKGPLWEEISAGMRRLGYNRNAKRCKEKWENINKYFKKVKESNKKRPEDSKTCPYFHQLDALYRNKAFRSSVAGAVVPTAHALSAPPQEAVTVTVAAPISQTPLLPLQPSQSSQHAAKNGESEHVTSGGGSGGMQIQATNFSVAAKKPEGMMKDTMEQRQPQQAAANIYNRIDGADSDNMDEDDDYDDCDENDDDDVDGNKMQYEIQFQRQQQQQHQNVVMRNAGGSNPAGTAAPSTATTTTGSFLGMVQ